MAEFGTNIDEDLQVLDARMKTLKLDYEQYFLGSRPRAPTQLRGDVQKMVAYYANVPIQNTALRFKFNNLRARYFTFKRHWDETIRKIEEGTYERHVFKADLHDRERAERMKGRKKGAAAEGKAAAPEVLGGNALFDAYRTAREECGQGTKGLTPEQFDKMLKTQEAAIRTKYKCEKVNFRVVVEDGKTKLKASPVRK
jgi:ferredoxin-NADP reductase